MHELAICQQLIGQVEEIARTRGAAAVVRVEVMAGPLAGIEPALLKQAFSVARSGSLARHATLHIETGAVRLRCRLCASESEVPANRLLCSECNAWQVDLISGTELVLNSVELSGLPDTGTEPGERNAVPAASGG